MSQSVNSTISVFFSGMFWQAAPPISLLFVSSSSPPAIFPHFDSFFLNKQCVTSELCSGDVVSHPLNVRDHGDTRPLGRSAQAGCFFHRVAGASTSRSFVARSVVSHGRTFAGARTCAGWAPCASTFCARRLMNAPARNLRCSEVRVSLVEWDAELLIKPLFHCLKHRPWLNRVLPAVVPVVNKRLC